MLKRIINKLTNQNNLVGYHKGQQIRVVDNNGVKARIVQDGQMNNVVYKDVQLTYDSLIICFDRIDKANDSAEVAYQQLIDNGYKNVYFAIDSSSLDYVRLCNKNFNVVDYKSDEFKKLYVSADFIFSSSCDNEIINYQGLRFDKKLYFTTKFVFLQHGVIVDDMSNWLVDKRFDYIIASTSDEYNFLKNECNILEDQILCVGLPRFKKLINQQRNMVLIAPTWRSYLTSDNFATSDFYKSWIKLLAKFDRYYDGEINFVLHPKFSQYKNMFENYSRINVFMAHEVEYDSLINEASAFITDYSSIFMDFKYLKKDVYFYQFDQDEFFNRHTYKMRLDYKVFGHQIDNDLEPVYNQDITDVEFYNDDLIERLKNKLMEV